MSVKRTGQLSFVEAMLPEGLRGSSRLDRLIELVKWYRFEKLLGRLRDEGPGRPGYLPLLMFKALLLQSLYGLSDAELEEALCDRLSFRRFVGLGLEDEVPDHTTLCRFRLKLIEADLLEKLFAELDRQLNAAGLILRRGTMLDATLIETAAASRPKGDAPPVDPDARLTSRKGKPGITYGYKAHVGRGRGLRSDPRGDHHASQRQRYCPGRSADPGRREGGLGRCGLPHPRPGGGAEGQGGQAPSRQAA